MENTAKMRNTAGITRMNKNKKERTVEGKGSFKTNGQFVSEMCPNCEAENPALSNGTTMCPTCGNVLIPCAQCDVIDECASGEEGGCIAFPKKSGEYLHLVTALPSRYKGREEKLVYEDFTTKAEWRWECSGCDTFNSNGQSKPREGEAMICFECATIEFYDEKENTPYVLDPVDDYLEYVYECFKCRSVLSVLDMPEDGDVLTCGTCGLKETCHFE